VLPFDIPILQALNQHVGVSASFDDFIVYLANDYLWKLTPLVLVIYGLWFMKPRDGVSHKLVLMNGLVGCLIAMTAARVLSKFLPYRVRPMLNPELDL
jgi:undecaprenyl-diphosphatase